jgi:electron transfer flavoprotein alpha subunit
MILTFIETRDGKVKKSSLEALSEAKRRADELGIPAAAVLIGPAADSSGGDIGACGGASIWRLDGPGLEAYSAQGFAFALGELVRETSPRAVFFAGTAMGRDLAPRLAARLGAALASDCVKVAASEGGLVFTRPIFAGKAFLTVSLKTAPAVATLRPNVFPVERLQGSAESRVVSKDVAIPEGTIRGRVAEVIREKGEALDVCEADIIVSGGRGMKGPENFALLQGLAAILPRAAVGASRSAVDSGWIGHAHQVGQTGKTVSPTLYLAFGISGAIQHLAGMSSSKVIVAVNKDPEAPIFKVADYGIVGDLFAVIPALEAELKKALAE